jgi:hypothetical protein
MKTSTLNKSRTKELNSSKLSASSTTENSEFDNRLKKLEAALLKGNNKNYLFN